MTTPFVIFDFDGVIADTERLHLAALQEVLRPRGVTLSVEEYESGYLGSTDYDLLVALATDRSLDWRSDDIESMISDKGEAFDRLLAKGSVVYPAAIPCVKRLAASGVTLAIASGAFRREIEAILDGAGLRKFFPVIVGAGEYAEGKPSPAPFLEAAKQTGLPAEAAVAIEDSPWGLTSARDAGCATIAITNTYSRSALSADIIVESLDEVDTALLRRAMRK